MTTRNALPLGEGVVASNVQMHGYFRLASVCSMK